MFLLLTKRAHATFDVCMLILFRIRLLQRPFFSASGLFVRAYVCKSMCLVAWVHDVS